MVQFVSIPVEILLELFTVMLGFQHLELKNVPEFSAEFGTVSTITLV